MKETSLQGSYLPMDLDAALSAGKDWQERLFFPLKHPIPRDLHLGMGDDFLALINDEPDDLLRDIALHAAPIIWMSCLGFYEQALLVQHARKLDIYLEGGPPETYELSGQTLPAGATFTKPLGLLPEKINNALARQLVRTFQWSSISSFIPTMLAPNAVAITHNSLLVSTAEQSDQRIRFKHANTFLENWGAEPVTQKLSDRLQPMISSIATLFSSAKYLNNEHAERLNAVLLKTLQAPFNQSAQAIIALGKVKSIPKIVWAGTGGYFPARAIRIETRRRGGHVTGFDHGGTSGMVNEPLANLLLELSVSDRFVTQTETSADAIRSCAEDRTSLFGGCEISGGMGDPGFRVPTSLNASERKTLSGSPRVLYVMSPFIGSRQRARPRQHDVVKLDWQLRLVKLLSKLSIELICQPHPEGALRGRPHPVSNIATVSKTRYEEVVDWADVILTDMILSTTTWKAACLPIPIVLIDLDMGGFNPMLEARIRSRFRILDATYNNRNLPEIDIEKVKDAIFQGLSSEEEDHAAYFRSIIGGQI